MRRLIIIGIVLFQGLIVGYASTCLAEEYPVRPLLSLERFSFSVGADHVWYQGEDSNLPAQTAEWEAAALGAYSLTKHLALAGSSRYALDSHTFQHRVGIRLMLGAD